MSTKDPVQRSCVDCGIYNCQYLDRSYPEFCLTTSLEDEDVEIVKNLYADEENHLVSKVSAEIEADFYLRYTRVEEIVAFSKRMGYRKIGIATCIGLIDESRTLAKILRKNGFEVYGAACKVASFDKSIADVDPVKAEATGHIMCNPIMQAHLLNKAGTDFNIVVGLCVGHDSLFYKYAESLCTTLVTKDRVLGHNPAVALYQAGSYYSKLTDEEVKY